MRAMRLLQSIIFLMLSVARTSAAPNQPSAAVIQNASKSVVRVTAQKCNGLPRTATGFVWSKASYVVTALHVVSGCKKIFIYSESAGVPRAADVIHILKKADLALLNVNNGPALPVLFEGSAPSVDDELKALGYPLNIPKMDSTSLRVRFGGKHLKDIIPQSVTNELIGVGSPDANVEIINSEGHLLPGLSGAPVIDSAGKVVGIGDGGLEYGTVGVSWALPSSYLHALLSSGENVTVLSGQSPYLFSAETEATSGPTVACGEKDFTKIRTVDFTTIAHTADDMIGLNQLAIIGGMDMNDLNFDVYQNLDSGATLVVPAGVPVTKHGSFCIADVMPGVIQIRIRANQYRDNTDAQEKSVEFEIATAASTIGSVWQPDPTWSYLAPMVRFDGLTVRRKSLVKYNLTPYGPVIDQNAFETLALRNGVFVGSSALDRDWGPVTLQKQQMCRFNPALPGCTAVNSQLRKWIHAVLAVHLTTFPIG